MRALLFPGQGTRIESDIRAWHSASEAVRDMINVACSDTGVSLQAMLAGGGRMLARTELLEPMLTALTVGITMEMDKLGAQADLVAGHSLGEVTACYAAGCMSGEAAVKLAAERGRLMAREAKRHPGGMVSIAANDREEAERILALAREAGRADLAVFNAPDQWVISGDLSALRAIARAHPTTAIAVEGAWHSFAMAGCVDELREAVRAAVTSPIGVRMVCNRTGGIVPRADDLPELLALQLTHPVQWTETMRTIAREGVTEILVVGPAKVLRALVRRNLGDFPAVDEVTVPADLTRLAATVAP